MLWSTATNLKKDGWDQYITITRGKSGGAETTTKLSVHAGLQCRRNETTLAVAPKPFVQSWHETVPLN